MERYCKTCAGTRFILEQGKTVCQICGAPYSEKGELLVDTKAALPVLCERGYQKLKAGEYSLAGLAFDRMLEIDGNSFMALLGKAIILSYLYKWETMIHDQDKTKIWWDAWKKILPRFNSTTPEERNLVKKYCEPLRFEEPVHVPKGSNLLMYAVISIIPELVRFLLDCGFDPNCEAKVGNYTISVLYRAAIAKKYSSKKGEIVDLLLKYGASPYRLAGDGSGVINSTTVPEIAQIIRKYYPDVKCTDARVSKPKISPKPAVTPVRKSYNRKNEINTKPPGEDNIGCLIVTAIIIVVILLSTLPNF